MVMCLAVSTVLLKVTSGKGLQNPQRGFEPHRRLCSTQKALEIQSFLLL